MENTDVTLEPGDAVVRGKAEIAALIVAVKECKQIAWFLPLMHNRLLLLTTLDKGVHHA
ncbi:hypothetical protein [Acidithiobacillus concretivorus]|uniref:hypothetical protein n=1 Tax=Acidithiobacillus concretivorus TaxID=3063952 RepID=UPI001D002353|nr:hypothetical protein [Acidithiobacillus concretivorus]